MPQNPKATAGAVLTSQLIHASLLQPLLFRLYVFVCVSARVWGCFFVSFESVFIAIFSVFALDLHLRCRHFLAGDSPSSCLACAIQS